jgi:BirA family biotin operon repressor/biotin-[acetyl-CoA-carboxylase] ligase
MSNVNQDKEAYRLNTARARESLRGWPMGHTIYYYSSVPSTMPLAHELILAAHDPAELAGTLLVAEEQTAGRGRLQRTWEAPPGRALLSSVIVAGAYLPEEPAQLPMLAGLAVADALQITCPDLADRIWLKWPNDVLIRTGDQFNKVAGILVETVFKEAAVDYSVLGIGINVNQQAREMPQPRPGGVWPISLRMATGRMVDRTQLLIALCQQLSQRFAPSQRSSVEEIHREWHSRLITLGQTVVVTNTLEAGQGNITGKAVDTTVTGELLVETTTGELRLIRAGDADVRWHPAGRPHSN